jgi:hypothetical protein
MTSTGIQVGTLTPTIDDVQASQSREGGRVQVLGFGPAEQRFQVRHLVIPELRSSDIPDRLRLARLEACPASGSSVPSVADVPPSGFG